MVRDGGNRMVRVALSHLPPPGRLGDGMTVCVVWHRTEGGPSQRAGTLDFDAAARIGRSRLTSPDPALTVRVTAEQEAQVGSPSDVRVIERELGG